MYNKTQIMKTAHELYRAGWADDFAEALRMAWANAKTVADVRKKFDVEIRTWYGWKMVGKEVYHDEHAVAKVTVFDAHTKKGTRVLAFFTEEQVCDEGTQPYEV